LSSAAKIPAIAKKVEWIRKWVGMDNDIHNLDKESILAIFELVDKNNRILSVMYPNEDIEKYKSENIVLLEKKLKEAEAMLGRKQMEIEFLNKMIEIANDNIKDKLLPNQLLKININPIKLINTT